MSLQVDLRQVIEERHREKIQTEQKLKDLEQRFKRMVEKRHIQKPLPNLTLQKQNTYPTNRIPKEKTNANLQQSKFTFNFLL